jgi:hypothetical protein
MIPTSIEILHALENHKHPVCHSKTEKHLHEKTLNCDFHFLKINQGYLTNNTYKLIIPVQETVIINGPYNFLLDHQPLSYQLRGPPALY